MNEISTKNMSRNEWLEIRKKGIGGSDSGAIVGLSKYKTAFDVYYDKMGMLETPDSEAMRLGRDLEEYVASRFTEATGKKVRRKNAIIYNDKYPNSFANVDRMVVGENAGLECKTANVLSLKRFKNSEYPEEYYCQCMHYMAVTGAEKWYLAVLILGEEFKVFEIERDEEEINALMKAESDFWEQHIEKHIPPIPDSNSRVDELYNGGGEGYTMFNDESLMRDFIEKKALIKKIESDLKKIENEIKVIMGDNEVGGSDNYKVSWKKQTRTNIDKKSLEKDINLTPYIKPAEYRVFKVEEKEN